jgi:hypothetical protein
MNTMLDPKVLSGKFVIVDSKLKSRYGKQPFLFGDRQWSNISNWVEDQLHEPSFDMELLMTRMTHKDCDIRWKNQRIWMGYVLSAARTDKMVVFGRKGETEMSKAPKLRARAYKQGIDLYELTKIIIDHRDKMVEWMKEKRKAVPRPKELIEAPVQEPIKAEVEIVLEEVENWEDLCE